MRKGLKLNKLLTKTSLGKVNSGTVYHHNMIHGFDAVTPERLNDLVFGADALNSFDDGISDEAHAALIQSAKDDAAELQDIRSIEEFTAWISAALGADLEDNSGAVLDGEIEALLRDLFDVEATPVALSTYILENPENWVSKCQWYAVLGQLGLSGSSSEDLSLIHI